MRSARSAVALAVAGGLLALAGCSGEASVPGESDIAVDTPELREQKAAAGIEDCEPGAGASGSNGLPALTLPCLGGGPDVDLSTLEGPILINLWASFCPPCVKEMPVLQEFDQEYGDQVSVLGIDMTDNSPVAALGLMRDTGATYPSIADPGGELLDQRDSAGERPLVGAGYPQFLIVGADGEVSPPRAGGFTTLDQVVDYVEQGLGTTL